MADAQIRAAENRCAAGPAGASPTEYAVNSTVCAGDQTRVGVVEQIEGVVAQHEGGGRLGAEDRIAFAGQVGEDTQVVLDGFAGRLHVAVASGAMPQPTWPGGT